MRSVYGKKFIKYVSVSLIGLGVFFNACSKEENTEKAPEGQAEVSTQASDSAPVDDGKGFGPVKSVEVPANIDTKLVAEGKAIFDMKCIACHDMNARKVGPALKDVTNRRKPEWIMNMIMNPAEMTQKDPVAKKLLGEYMTQMANQNVDEKSARAVLEYFRNNDKK